MEETSKNNETAQLGIGAVTRWLAYNTFKIDNMKSNEEIFGKIAVKQNPDFNHQQFAQNNWRLYSIIINSMEACQRPLKDEIKRLKKIIDDDTDYKAMRNYAKELEHKLGINQESGK